MEGTKQVTIIIEDGERAQTIIIPFASGVRFDVEYEDDTSYDILEHSPAVIDTMTVSFHPVPDEEGTTHLIKNEVTN